MDEFTRKQADTVFQQALELPETARAAFLDEACSHGSPVRALVDRLLAASDETEEPIQIGGGARGALWEALAQEQTNALLIAPGERLGPWVIMRTLGRGGMATVYLAQRADGNFEQTVALKVLDATHDFQELAARFAQERQILATLDNPNIARLIDAGFGASGQPYVAMEFVDGEAIDVYCDRLSLSIEQRIDLFAKIADAVHHAHTHLVVHRDIKASNVMITVDGQPKLLDFGIAKLLDPSSPHAAPPTRTELHLMTPEYASPEQVRGEVLTTASDVYQLGHLLYRLLTGCEPYRVEHGGLAAIVETICGVEPLPPSQVFAVAGGSSEDAERTKLERIAASRSLTPATLRRRLAGDLDTIVLTSLRKEPSRRYPSVLQLREDLRRHLQGRPIAARTPTLRYRAAKFARRNRLGVAASMLAFVIFVGGVSATIWQAQAAEMQAQRATEVRDFLVGLFESVDPDATLGTTVTARELLDRGAQQLSTRLTDAPVLRAEMMDVVGRMYVELGLYPQARELFEQARAALVESGPDGREERAHNALDLSGVLAVQGEFAEAEQLAREAVAMYRSLRRPPPRQLANSIANLAGILSNRAADQEADSLYQEALTIDRHSGDDAALAEHLSAYSSAQYRAARYEEAQAAAEDALSLQRRLFGLEHTTVASTLLNLGTIVGARGEYVQAKGFLNDALNMRRTLLGEAHPETAEVLNNLGHVLQSAGELDEAESMHLEALAIRIAAFGERHPESANSLNHLGIVQYFRTRYAEAARTFERVAPLWREIHGPLHPNVLSSLNNLGAALRESGDRERAETVLREVLALRRQVLGENHREVAQSMNNLGLLLAARRADDEAEQLIRGGIDMWRASMGADHPDVGDGLASLGKFLLERKRYPEAEPVLRESLEIRTRTLGVQAPMLASARLRLGECLFRLGRVDEAEPLIEESVPALIDRFGEADPFTHRSIGLREELRRLRTMSMR